ncbi:MAG: nucleotidyltransferase domain-containing protein, partial [Chloroflexota bacterium]
MGEIERRLEALARAMARDGIRLACLFGSVLKHPQARDVDLAVLFREYDFERYLETLETACRALETSRVDLVVLNRANAPLKLRALLEGKLVFAKTPLAYAEAVAEALFEYEDYRRFMAEYRLLLGRRCQEGLSVVDRRVDRERVEGYLSILDEA